MTTPWPAKRRVAVHQHRQHLLAPACRRGVPGEPATLPSTTGLTISRCDGLNASDRCTGPPSVETGRWRSRCGTSRRRQARSSACLPSNSANRSPGILPSDVDQHVQAAAVGHADHDFLHALLEPACCTTSSIAAMKLSPPSSEKRFWPTYLVWRKRSRPSDAVRRLQDVASSFQR